MAKKALPKPIMTKDKKYQCPEDKEIYSTEKEYEKHCEAKHTKK